MLEQIEQKYHFEYPSLYKQLFADNMLYVGVLGADWLTREFPKIRTHPTLLLFGNDFGLMDFAGITSEIEQLSSPDDYRQTKKDLRFIPFAMTGAGDSYCFYLNGQKGDDILITLVWHDMNCVDILAKNLQDFIFRGLLEAVVDIEDESFIRHGDLKENIGNMLRSHCKYLTGKQQKIAGEIYQRDIFSYSYKQPNGSEITLEGLLTYDELNKILASEIGFEGLNTSFEYQESEQNPALNDRIVGTLSLHISPIPQKHDKISEKLKALNWKSVNSGDVLIVQRKNVVFFGKPSMDNMDEVFSEKLQEIKAACPDMKIVFEENETGAKYEI
jgi:hypothetical protein